MYRLAAMHGVKQTNKNIALTNVLCPSRRRHIRYLADSWQLQ